ncbi:hypothetical protein Ahia01_000539700 [Argonauta hians]
MIWYFILPVALVVLVIAYRVGSALWYYGKPLEYEGRGLRMDGKTVLITGASSGVGKSTTKFLLARGARVIMACRNLTKARNVADELLAITGVEPTMVTIVHLELSDLDSVRLCGRQILDTESKLDLLVNNAGVTGEGKLTTKQGFEHIFGTNYIGPFLLTHILTPLLKKSAPSRIINVSSTTHRYVKKVPNFSSGSGSTPSAALTPTVRYPDLSTYPISKLANIWHANILAENLKKDGVTANSLCPGYVHSGIWYNGKSFASNFFGWLASKVGRDPDMAALTLLYMAIEPSLDKVTGKFFENLSVSSMAPFAKDMTLAQKMWDILDTESKLDLLVNNAGLAWEGKLTTKQGFNHIFGTNYIGPFLLTHILTPLLKKSAPSRIINVSSISHRSVKKVPNFSSGLPSGSDSGTVTPSAVLTPTVRYPHLSTYAISKLANIWHANILAENLKKDGVTANSLCPGYVHTGIWFNEKFFVMNFFGWLASKLGRNPDTAALTLLYMAIDPSLDKVTGKFFENVSVSNMAPFAKDMTLAQKMWDVSMDMCGLSKKKNQ